QFFDIVTTGAGLSGANTVAIPAGYTFAPVGNVGRLTFVGASVVPESGTLPLLLSAITIGTITFAARRRFAA
ncbi:MAG: PEP-CTERM sorting domain-containing protein, partial [Armatimonadetes bacterium]|nr:PEP-CTERM sorting domain-containing protein [Armatimonadota bacterium]